MQNPSSGQNRRVTAALLIAALCPFVASLVLAPNRADRPAHAATLAAQDGTIWDGVYTDEQAARGMKTYEQECAACHLDDLMGDGIAPALIGSSFFFRWSDLSVGDMYTAIRTTMPQGAPASLSPAGYADIAAFLLQKNKVPAGADELPTVLDDLEAIKITEAQ